MRSPLAENIFRHLAIESGLAKRYIVDSAGTSSYHIGEAPDSRMRKVAASHGIHYSGRARQFKPTDFEHFDLVVALDVHNREDLVDLAPSSDAEKKIRLLREFDPESRGNLSIPDPYYGGIKGFEEVYLMIARSCRQLLDVLESGELGIE